MQNYTHKKIAETIRQLDQLPSDPNEYDQWITAADHLCFMDDNANSDEIIIFANGAFTYIDTILVPRTWLARSTPEDTESMTFSSYSSIAGYVWGGGRNNVRVERGVHLQQNSKQVGTQLVFCRTFEGWEGKGQRYIEVNQEFTHIAEVHWRPEKHAYCRYDSRGDLEASISVTVENSIDTLMLVTIKWGELEKYLAATDSVLIRRFDFTLLRHDQFNGWPDTAPSRVDAPNEIFYRQLVCPGHAAYTAGRQLIRPRRNQKTIHDEIKGIKTTPKNKAYVKFTAIDWRNNIVTEISTDPKATSNYFEAKDNSLPFELSPAFFRPEVLSKYKMDRDKYIFRDRDLYCRTAWRLKGIETNEAGQVHAYICDLRNLPYEEQLHWLSYNERPKASISQRAITNDFEGKWIDSAGSLNDLLYLLREWRDKKITWWAVSDEKLFERVTVPLSTSRDEWAEAIMDLAKLVVEGFRVKPIRTKLDEASVPYNSDERSISLLEKLLNHNLPSNNSQKLYGLRAVQLLRSKVKGHVTGSEGEHLTEQALQEHETFSNHFRHTCSQIHRELQSIEALF